VELGVLADEIRRLSASVARLELALARRAPSAAPSLPRDPAAG
jgi:hypothetical protein